MQYQTDVMTLLTQKLTLNYSTKQPVIKLPHVHLKYSILSYKPVEMHHDLGLSLVWEAVMTTVTTNTETLERQSCGPHWLHEWPVNDPCALNLMLWLLTISLRSQANTEAPQSDHLLRLVPQLSQLWWTSHHSFSHTQIFKVLWTI